MPQRGMINKIKPRIMASARTLKETILSLQIPDLTTMGAVVAPHAVMTTRVTKNAADLILGRGSPGSNGRSPRSGEGSPRGIDNRDANPETFTQIHVSTLKRESGENDIRREFGKFGAIEKVMIRDHYCFVKFEEH